MSVEPKPNDAQEVPVTLGFKPDPPFASSDYVPPPPIPASRKSNAAVWIVAIVGALMAAGAVFAVLVCGVAGFLVYLGAPKPAPEMIEYSGSSAVPFDAAYPEAPADVWSDPAYVGPGTYDPSAIGPDGIAPSAAGPGIVEPDYVDDDYGSAFSGLYEEPKEEYDPDWQLTPDEATAEAIRYRQELEESGFP